MTDRARERVLHCWADRFEVESAGVPVGSDRWVELYLAPSATCMLPAHGLDVSHEWTDDEEIGVTFADAGAMAPAEAP